MAEKIVEKVTRLMKSPENNRNIGVAAQKLNLTVVFIDDEEFHSRSPT